MDLQIRPFLLKPQWMNGLSERLLVSHYENNYGGALRRLNAIQSASCGPRLGAHAHVRDQRPQARRADRCGLGDPARDLFRFARRTRRQSAHRASRAARRARPGARARFRQRHGLARRVYRHGEGAGRRFRLGDPRLVRALGPAGQPVGGRPRARPARRYVRSSRSTCTSMPIISISARGRPPMSIR